MKFIKILVYLLAVGLGLLLATRLQRERSKKAGRNSSKKQTKKITMDDTEWKEKLTPSNIVSYAKPGQRDLWEVYSTFKSKA